MPHTDLSPRQRHFYEVRLEAGGGVIYTGKGPTVKAARAKARALAKSRGGLSASVVNAMTEHEPRSLIGPKPRTFKGNTRLPGPV